MFLIQLHLPQQSSPKQIKMNLSFQVLDSKLLLKW